MYSNTYREVTKNDALSGQEKALEAIAERAMEKHAKVLARIAAAKEEGTI